MSGSRQTAFIFCAGIFLISTIYWPFGMDANIGIRQLLVALVLGITFFRFFFGQESLSKQDFITWIYILFVVFNFLSSAWAPCAAEAFETGGRFAAGFLVFVAARHLYLKEPVFEKFLCLTALVLGGLAGLLGLWEIWHLENLHKEQVYLVTGFNAHKNLFASSIFLLLFYIWRSFRFFRQYRIMIILVLALDIILLALLQSRAVLLSAIFLISALLITRLLQGTFKRPALLAACIYFLLFAVLTFALPLYLDRLTTVSSGLESEERLQLWKKTYDVLTSHWLCGLGAGNWQVYFPSAGLDGMWRAEDLNVTFQRPHNDLLWILAETGITGLAMFLAVCCLAFYHALRKQSTSESVAGWWIIGFLIISFFDFPFERTEHIVFFNLLLAFSCRQEMKKSSYKGQGQTLVLLLASAILGVIFFMRLEGETYARKIHDARAGGNATGMLKNAHKSENVFYRLDPFSLPIAWYAANAKQAAGDRTGAAQDFERAMKFAPWNRNVLNDYASLCVLEGNKAEARQLYKKVIRISPRFDDAKLNLAAVYLNEDSLKEAERTLKTLLHDSERRTNYEAILKVKKLMRADTAKAHGN